MDSSGLLLRPGSTKPASAGRGRADEERSCVPFCRSGPSVVVGIWGPVRMRLMDWGSGASRRGFMALAGSSAAAALTAARMAVAKEDSQGVVTPEMFGARRDD